MSVLDALFSFYAFSTLDAAGCSYPYFYTYYCYYYYYYCYAAVLFSSFLSLAATVLVR